MGAAFENFQFDLKHDEVLARALSSLDRINFAGISYDQKGDIYEYLIAKMADAGVKGEFFTPRPIVDLIVHILAPGVGMRVWDPACGTGGFLTRAFDAVARNISSDAALSTEERKVALQQLRSKAIYGNETKSVSARLARLNMILHGDGHTTILEFNSLDRQSYTRSRLEIRGERQPNPLPTILKAGGFDRIMGNPPYGGSQAVSDVGARFKPWHKTSKPEANFLQVMMHALAPGGRCGVVMPEGVLFRRDEAKIRERLLRNFELEAVIGLFKGVFEFAEVKACILVFRRPRVDENWKGTERVWIAEARSFDEVEKTAQRFALRIEDEASKFVSLEEISEKNLTLKPSKYLKVVPSDEALAIPLQELFERLPDGKAIGPEDIVLKLSSSSTQFRDETTDDDPARDTVLRGIDSRLDKKLLQFYFDYGPLAKKWSSIISSSSLEELWATPAFVPVPDKDRQVQLIQRLETQRQMPALIQSQMATRYRREWVDDAVFEVSQANLLATSFEPLVSDVSSYIDPTDEPDTEWKVYGVTNDDGVRLSEIKRGSDFKAGRKYKRLISNAIVYNPQRINVGSAGLVGTADGVSLISPYYPQFSCKEDLDPEFALTLIRSPYFRRLIEETAIGAVRHELFFSLFIQIAVPIPTLAFQKSILTRMANEIERLAPMGEVRQRSAQAISDIVERLLNRCV